MSTDSVPTVSEIIAAAVAAGRASADESVADILEREGFIVSSLAASPSAHAVTDHPGRVGSSTSYLAAEPLELADGAGGSRRLGVGDLLHADEVRAARTSLGGLLHRHQVVAVPSDRGVVGLASALFQRIDRLERLLAALHAAGRSG
jgi:hypothetical protein